MVRSKLQKFEHIGGAGWGRGGPCIEGDPPRLHKQTDMTENTTFLKISKSLTRNTMQLFAFQLKFYVSAKCDFTNNACYLAIL